MKQVYKAVLIFSFTFYFSEVFPQRRLLYDTLTKPKLVARQFGFTEGCSVDRKGNVFFTDQNNNKIWKYDTNGRLTLFLDSSGRSNGTYFDKKGNLIACADEHNQLWSISPKGEVTVLLKDYQGKLMNGPNDVWVDNKGGIYMTDPYYQRPWWTRTKSDLDGQKVYYLPKDAVQPVIVIDNFDRPNGIVGTPDGKYLYCADVGVKKTYKYQIKKDGTLSDQQLFAEQGSDGMTLDAKGNVYFTSKAGVTIYSAEGKKIINIPIPEPSITNVCFSGKNKDVLFITATTAVYTLKMNVRGVE
jgi:gluconolactonase